MSGGSPSALLRDLGGMSRTARGRLAGGTVLGVLASLASIGLLLTSGWLISRAAQHPPVLYLMVAIVAVRAFGIARAALRYAERLATHDGALRVGTDLRVAVYRRLERLAPSTLAAGRRGDRVARIVGDVDAVGDLLVRVFVPRIVTAVSAGVVVGLVLVILPAGGVLLGACVVLGWLLAETGVRFGGRTASAATTGLRGVLAAEVAESVRAAREIAAYGASATYAGRIASASSGLAHAERRTAFLDGAGTLAIRFAMTLALVGIASLGVAAVAAGDLDPVLLAVVVLAPLALLEPLEAVPGIVAQEQRSTLSRRRLLELSAQRDEALRDPQDPVAPRSSVALHVRDLRLGWGEAPDLVAGFDLDLDEGATVLVTGPSGAGKSTLAAALLRLAAPRGGSITIGGVETSTMTGADVRARIGLLRQDEHVFDTSVRENLRIADPDADDERLLIALRGAGLGPLLDRLPDGLETEVGENGRRLSGGERQRLGLARLLLADHRVLVLDEPTEHLDPSAADRLVDDLLALAPARSLLVLSHDPRFLARGLERVRLDAWHPAGATGAVVGDGATAAPPGQDRRALT
ncbi:ATP-binding cassette subfamily C protein CydC [Mumia flava]|uniref:ATP-binding cassette subfamily C protein CydC n=1 Tax=Mumia flava TaxID=1348852 RepID=A0A2M9BEM1_9ACTN|nr:thiol reductant ABC exporter subunit CydC [Mumia flava]PJJ56392.1 ATP-binding cassette subfamily C protein CydC [Mumia flava]